MNISPVKAKRLARKLLRENRKRNWRAIAKQDYDNMISFATLNKIANSHGVWLPKDERLLIVLGLVQIKTTKPVPEPLKPWQVVIKKKIAVMAKQTRLDLGLQK